VKRPQPVAGRPSGAPRTYDVDADERRRMIIALVEDGVAVWLPRGGHDASRRSGSGDRHCDVRGSVMRRTVPLTKREPDKPSSAAAPAQTRSGRPRSRPAAASAPQPADEPANQLLTVDDPLHLGTSPRGRKIPAEIESSYTSNPTRSDPLPAHTGHGGRLLPVVAPSAS
jgi:hypothetical protein